MAPLLKVALYRQFAIRDEAILKAFLHFLFNISECWLALKHEVTAKYRVHYLRVLNSELVISNSKYT